MDPAIGAAGISAGGSILESLGERLFGGKDTRELRRFMQYLRSKMGRDVFSGGQQRQIASDMNMAGIRERNQYANMVTKRAGLDSGVALGAISEQMLPQNARTRAELAMLNERLKTSRDTNISGMLSSGYKAMM